MPELSENYSRPSPAGTLDRFEILYKVARIGSRASLDIEQGLKDILQTLVRSLSLADSTFLYLSPRSGAFTRAISASDNLPCLPFDTPLAETPTGRALQLKEPVCEANAYNLPVFCSERSYGVLVIDRLNETPLPRQTLDILTDVCTEIANLLRLADQREEENWRLDQSTIISDLSHQLNHARNLKDLLETTAKSIHRKMNAACVILRPLIGGTLLGRSCLRLSPDYRQYRALFQQQEEEQAPAVLDKLGPVYFTDLSFDQEEGFPGQMVIIPLACHGQTMGSLTLFFGEQDEGFGFANQEATKHFFTRMGMQIAHALERVATLERLETLSDANDQKYNQLSLLYRSSRAMHSTLQLNALMHLILSAATVPAGGGFERAILFTVNERSGTLQGMLGVSRETASLVLPPTSDPLKWENPELDDETRSAQMETPFNQLVKTQRLPLDAEDNSLARAALTDRVIMVADPKSEPAGGAGLARQLGLGPYACAPLCGNNHTMGVLVVDNPQSKEPIGLDRLRFLELFANQATNAMENSMLLQRIEAMYRDLHETQERLIQGEKMAALGEMAASIAHELRTPLVPIGGFANRLRRIVEPSGKAQEYCEIIIRETLRMEQLLTEILAFAKRQMLCIAQCHIPNIIDRSLLLSSETLQSADIRTILEVQDDLPHTPADEQKLLQVLINLIDNARHAMVGGGTLTVRAYRSILRAEPCVAIDVQDTGGGVSPKILTEIFTPFYSTKEKGTGLGLAISQRIIQQHHGTIEVSNDDLGAKFTLRLLLKIPSEASAKNSGQQK